MTVGAKRFSPEKVLLVCLFGSPAALWIFICVYIARVIDDPGWGPHGNQAWQQPSWLAGYHFSDDQVWVFPNRVLGFVAFTYLAPLVYGLVCKRWPFVIGSSIGILSCGILRVYYAVASF